MKFIALSAILLKLSATSSTTSAAFLVPTARNFGVAPRRTNLHNKVLKVTIEEEAVDYDAPLERLMAVGDIVPSGDPVLLDHEIIVDDECYAGKNGDFKECVDFDPLHGNGVVSKQGHSNESTDFDAPLYKAKAAGNIVSAGDPVLLDHEIVVDDEPTADFDPLHGNGVVSKNGPSNELTDFDAPLYKAKAAGNIVSAGEPTLLDHEIIVDDECYAGKNGDFDECADFDPLHGNGVVSKSGPSNELTDFDAPLYRAKAVGNIVTAGEPTPLDHEIVVDDECYMGKDSTMTQCVDFDPLHP